MRPHGIRRLLATTMWVVAVIVLVAAARRHLDTRSLVPPLPSPGDSISLLAVQEIFDARLSADGDHWLLVTTSSCPYCLSLDSELTLIERAASCAGANLVPLIIEVASPPDSMMAVFAKHAFPRPGVGGEDAFHVLKVRAVPSLVVLAPTGHVMLVSSPLIEGSWPPTPQC